MSSLSPYRLVSEDGHIDCPLPYTMLFVGRSECDINVQGENVDKRHALVTYDHYQSKFQIKDLGTAAGTYINERKIPDQTFITIEDGDSVRLGKESAVLRLERNPVMAADAAGGTHLPHSHSLGVIHRSGSNSSSHSHSEDGSHSRSRTPTPNRTQSGRSSTRPTWDKRPSLAECEGCIREQDIHHSCGINSELNPSAVHLTHTHMTSTPTHMTSTPTHTGAAVQSNTEADMRVSPVSPLNILTNRQLPSRSTTDSLQYTEQPPDQMLEGYYRESEYKDLYHEEKTTTPPPVCYTIDHRGDTLRPHTQPNVIPKRGTPLYGQPTWWGESDADEHNRRLLIDIQKQKEEDKHQQKVVEEERTLQPAANQSNDSSKSTPITAEVSADSSKSLAFTVDLEDSSEVQTPKPDANISGDKLSNFLPDNLRKSIRERKERLGQQSERNHSENNSPSLPRRRSKSPNKLSSQQTVPKESRRYDANSTTSTSIYLINKMLYSSGDASTRGQSDFHPETRDDQTEYAMYSEAKALNRSSTMPELKPSQGAPRRVLRKSQTAESLGQVDDEGDKVSESGTYTIEEDNKELEKAREDIDKLFGIVDPLSSSPSLEITESPENLLEVSESMQVEIGSDKTTDTYTLSGSHHSTTKKEGTESPRGEEQSDQRIESPQQNSQHNNNVVASKPPISPTFRSRSPEGRGTHSPSQRSSGRRLPAVPRVGRVKEDSRHSTPPPLTRSNTMPRRKKEVEFSKEKILQELGIGDTPVIEKERPKLVEELLTTRTYHKDNDPIVVNKTTFFDKILSSTMAQPEQSKDLPQYSGDTTNREKLSRVGGSSVDSVNTDVLLQSTDEFMKAIHSFSSQSEASKSTSASKPRTTVRQSSTGSLRKSAADRLNNNTSTRGSGDGGDPVTPRGTSAARRSMSDTVTARLSGAKRSQSVKDSDNNGSLESINNTKNLSNSNGKVGPLTSSRPNRTFELRRARTESLESENSATITPRTNGARTGRSTRSLDPSEVSLGAKIVQKSRENGAVMESTRQAPLRRSDGGRYSMRATSTSKVSNGKSSSVNTPSVPKSASAKKTNSRPNSNSMIAKAEREREAGKEREKAAWDRRRTYDPRRAVQEKNKPISNGNRKGVKSAPQCSAPYTRSKTKNSAKPAFDLNLIKVKAKARKSDSRGGTPSTGEEPSTSSTRPRANSYSGTDVSSVDTPPTSQYNQTSDTRHSADVFQPMESNSLKLNLEKENDLEDSSHELEIAQLSHNLAKDLELMSKADRESTNRYDRQTNGGGKVKENEPSPETEELIDSMFACQQQKSAFSSYRSAASVTPSEMAASPALSPMRKKLSSSQNLDNGSPSTVDHSYNNLVLTSIQRLSAKLQTYTASTVDRLRDKGVSMSNSPSPTEEHRCDDMPANSTLASILKTLKQVEQNCKVMDKALFTTVPQSELSTVSNNEHEHYLAEIKRIRHEIAGFKPIESEDNKSSKGGIKSLATSSSKTALNKPRTSANSAKLGNSTYKQRPVFY